jgi:hypothetical protein
MEDVTSGQFYLRVYNLGIVLPMMIYEEIVALAPLIYWQS